MTQKAIEAKQNLTNFKIEVEKVIDKYFQQELIDTQKYTSYAVDYITELKNIVLVGGKRLRGSFVYYTYLLFGGKNIAEILKISTALEVVHAFLLVEDDFMDQGATRRGYPTIHETYKQYHQKNKFKKDSLHFGESIAVNVGIIGDHMALNLINNSNFPAEIKLKGLDQLNRQIIITGHGQIHDILNEVRTNLSEEDILNVLNWKTGIYTYDNPIQLGAIFAGADQSSLKKLSEYAIPGGVAFQIQDDILGSFGKEDLTGKPADGDIKEGKQTLLTFKAYQKATQSEKQLMDEVLGNLDASEDQINKVREIFVRTGALEYSKQKALELVKNAKAALLKNREVNWQDQGVDYLEGIADYMIDRDL